MTSSQRALGLKSRRRRNQREMSTFPDVVDSQGRTSLHLYALEGDAHQVKMLLDAGVTKDVRDFKGQTAMHLSAFKGHKKIVKRLIKAGFKVNAEQFPPCLDSRQTQTFSSFMDPRLIPTQSDEVPEEYVVGIGQTPLYLCASSGHADILKILAEAGALVNEKDFTGMTPLHVAADNNHKEVVEILIDLHAEVDAQRIKFFNEKGFRVNAVRHDRYTPLHLSAANGHKQVVEVLIEKGANVDERSDSGLTPLHLSASNGHKEVVEILIKKGATVDAISISRKTPLHLSASNGHKEVVDFLIKKGAIVDAIDDSGQTPLHLSASNGHKEVVEILIKKGAIVDAINITRKTPLHLSALNGHKEVVDFLVKKGAIVDAISDSRQTPLHLSASNGHKEVVEFLIRKGATVKQFGFNRTPLHISASNGHKDIVDLLLSNDADINAGNKSFGTALHASVDKGHKDIVDFLLKKGAEVNVTNQQTETPLHRSVINGHKEIVDILIKAGANVDATDSCQQTPLHLSVMKTNENKRSPNENELFPFLNAFDCNKQTPLPISTVKRFREITEILLNSGAHADVVDSMKQTPLHKICAYRNNTPESRQNCKEIVELLLRKGAQVNHKDIHGLTPLLYCARDGRNEFVMELLLKNGCDINVCIKRRAVGSHHTENFGWEGTNVNFASAGVQGFPFGVNFNNPFAPLPPKIEQSVENNGADQGNRGQTALHICASDGNTRMVELLLEAGISPQVKDEQGQTPLHICKGKDVINTLIDHGASVNAKDSRGETPLHKYSRSEDAEAVKALLEKNALVDVENEDGATAMHLARNKEIVQLLLNYGASASKETLLGDTPLSMARARNDRDLILMLMKAQEDEKKAEEDARIKRLQAHFSYGQAGATSGSPSVQVASSPSSTNSSGRTDIQPEDSLAVGPGPDMEAVKASVNRHLMSQGVSTSTNNVIKIENYQHIEHVEYFAPGGTIIFQDKEAPEKDSEEENGERG